MEDRQIVELYWERSEQAITATADKYGRLCHYIAHNILHNDLEAEECVNDTYFKAWNAIPPEKPDALSPFLARITRNLALNRYQANRAKKRGGGQVEFVLDEWSDCLPEQQSRERIVDDIALADAFNRFLASLSKEHRKIFVRRYWFMSTIQEIAEGFSMSESKVKMILLRTRRKLKEFLEKEGIEV